MRVSIPLILILLSLFSFSKPVFSQTPRHPTTVEMLSEYRVWEKGQKGYLALFFKLEPGWHVYFVNPGDSGTAPRIKWQAPQFLETGELQWPVPQRIKVGPLVNYGYESEITLPVSIQVNDRAPSRFEQKIKIDWLVCRESCIPGKKEISVAFEVGESKAPSSSQSRIQSAVLSLPISLTTQKMMAEQIDNKVKISWEGPQSEVDFFPRRPGQFSNTESPVYEFSGNSNSLTVALDSQLTEPVTEISGLIVEKNASKANSFWISLPIKVNKVASTFLQMLLFAFIGGLILNLMPCVFPVLSIKILGFVEQAGKSPKKIRVHGWFFTIGVLLSFWTLAGGILALQFFGRQIGWGFQLQNPGFVIFMILLLFLMALNFFGAFELGNSLMSVGSSLTQKEGYASTFFSGILATLVATPCTAPFMGTAIGFALGQSTFKAFLVFTFLGLGMCLPYLALCYFPGFLKKLPKPGAWMEVLKHWMGFPLLGTTIWLIWVLGQQVGIDGLLRFLFALLFFTMAVCALPKPHSKKKERLYFLFTFFCLVGAYFISSTLRQGQPAENISHSNGLTWESFSQEKLEALRKEGKAVFLDFTAAWCVSCQVNEKVTFSSLDVQNKVREKNLVLMKADWTNGNPEITKMLKQYNRSGVPFYLLFPINAAKTPLILPEVLTPQIFLNYLEKI